MIQDIMEEEGRTVRWLAQKLSCDRSNIYKIYEKRTKFIYCIVGFTESKTHSRFFQPVLQRASAQIQFVWTIQNVVGV